jgi:hypothetical protein
MNMKNADAMIESRGEEAARPSEGAAKRQKICRLAEEW